MATFKDIAKAAGVSYGTVSNVLNKRGNVSSEKIGKVLKAAAELSYIPNQAAKDLRKGRSENLAVVLPNIFEIQYVEFFEGFRTYAQQKGYCAYLYIHESCKALEEKLAVEIRASLAAGVAVISCLAGSINPYKQAGFDSDEIVFVERHPFAEGKQIIFNFEKVGLDFAKQANQYQTVSVITDSVSDSSSEELLCGFKKGLSAETSYSIYHDDRNDEASVYRLAFEVMTDKHAPDAVFTMSYAQANAITVIQQNFCNCHKPTIYTLSPSAILPEEQYQCHELDYRIAGEQAAELLISNTAK